MLKLIPPGRRKGNRFFLVRGRLGDNDVEISTGTSDPIAAARVKIEVERQILEGRIPGPGEEVTFRRAADLYMAARNPAPRDRRCIERLQATIADKPVADVLQADIDIAAMQLHGADTAETRNRNVYTPAAAVLHYAADNRWRAYERYRRPKLKSPETRAASDEAAQALLDATQGKQHMLLLWLFKHGTRISGALQVDCSRIDLLRSTYELFITKTGRWRTFAIDDEVWQLLANDPDVEAGAGLLFPWKSRWRVYDWLQPLCQGLGVRFTPHMARHWLGKRMRQAGLRTIMDALGQSDMKSAIRYVAEDLEAVRDGARDVPKLGKPSGKKALKA